MRYLYAIIFLIGTFQANDLTPPYRCQNSSYILDQSKKQQDPEGAWPVAGLSFHIQEPRPQTPQRFSKLRLDNRTGAFSLIREYEPGTIERIIDEKGNAEILLNGSPDISEELRKEYRLNNESNFGYRSFYQTINGLPMSLTANKWLNISDAQTMNFDGREVYSIQLELKEPMISKYWTLMIAADNYNLVALRFRHEDSADQEDELIIFDGDYRLDSMTIPRFRHWYLFDSREYLGSDVILK